MRPAFSSCAALLPPACRVPKHPSQRANPAKAGDAKLRGYRTLPCHASRAAERSTDGAKVQAQTVTEWLEPGERRIQLVGASGEQRQVRFGNGWETADYVPFKWGELEGELVFITAHDGTALDFSLTSGEIPRLFRIGVEGGVALGKSGRGPGLLGVAFGQRFTVAGLDRQCFSFQSSDTMRPANAPGLSRRTLFGYACAPTEAPRARVEEFLRSIRFVDRGFVEDDDADADAAEADDARQFALGREERGAFPRGLAEVPLGYAVPDPDSGG